MPRLYSSNQIVKVLKRKGFVFVSQKGSHMKYRNETQPVRTAIVPEGRKEIPLGTVKSIMRQAGLEDADMTSR